MDETFQSAEIANTATNLGLVESATSMWDKGLIPFGQRGVEVDTSRSLILMCFKPDSCDLDPTGIPQPSLVKYGRTSQLVAQATQVIHTSGEPLILTFQGSAWHLRILTRTARMPSVWATGFSEFEEPTTCVVMQAKLNVPQPSSLKQPTNFSVPNAWLAVAPQDHDVAISSFLSTVLNQVSTRTEL